MVGLDRNNKPAVIIEAKFWAALTENQPNAYLNRLPQKGVLLFVAPAQRIESLWAELRKLAKVTQPRPDDEKTEFKSVMVGKRYLMPDQLEISSRMAGDGGRLPFEKRGSGIARTCRQARSGCVFADTPDEFAPEIPRRMLNLITLVDDAVTRAKNDGSISTPVRSVVPQATGYGRYVFVAEAGAWFGIDFARWARADYPDTPLWLRLEEWEGGDDNRPTSPSS